MFVVGILALAVFAPQFMPFATNLFVYVLTDHIEGLIAGAFVGLLGPLATKEVKVGIFTVSIGAIAGTILQYLLFR